MLLYLLNEGVSTKYQGTIGKKAAKPVQKKTDLLLSPPK